MKSGVGGTGAVYKAEELETKRIYAVKQLHPGASSFESEVRLARSIDHLNVCRVYESFRQGDRDCILMEFVDGETLRDRLDRSGSLSIEQALPIARQILDGLEAAHRNGVIHRDLNPQNVMISRDGAVKIMDFGIARPYTRQYTRKDLSGTPGYMSPEQLRGEPADARTDLYAFGCTLRHMILDTAGIPPFVEDAIYRCIKEDPKRRFASAAEVRHALKGSRSVVRTGILVASLLVTLTIGVVSLRKFPVQVQAPPATTVAEELPTVAIIFQGDVGKAFTNALVERKRFRVVDRGTVDGLLSELRRKKRELDPQSAQQIGHVLGARYFLVGSSQAIEGEIRVDVQLIATETTEVKIAKGVRGKVADREKLAEQLAAVVAEASKGLGGRPSL